MSFTIGIKLDDSGFENVDLRYPELGNPGIGGTSFEEIFLAKEAANRGIAVKIYHTNNSNILPDNIQDRCVNNVELIPQQAKQDGCNILIFSAAKTDHWYEEIQRNQIDSIVWAHGFLNYYELKILRKNPYVKRVVFVGREEYNQYIADDIILKSTYVYNMFGSQKARNKDEGEHNVVYLGGLNKYKGFHILAKAWKQVLDKVPDAKLKVLGTGKLYNRDTALGKYNIAKPDYEKTFINYLLDDNKEILPSVDFVGLSGLEKYDIIRDSRVGVVNPSGLTETFCISAVEMESCGVPVCTTGKYGLLDTVKNEKNGLYSNDDKELAANIVKLLLDDKLNETYSANAVAFSKKFTPEAVMPEWMQVFDEILNNKEAEYIKPSRNQYRPKPFNVKLRLHDLRFNKGMKNVPSFIGTELCRQGLTDVWLRDIVKHYFMKNGIQD